MDRNLDLSFTAIDSIHEIRTNTKANSFFKIIHNYILPIHLQALTFNRPIQREFLHHNPMWDVRLNKLK